MSCSPRTLALEHPELRDHDVASVSKLRRTKCSSLLSCALHELAVDKKLKRLEECHGMSASHTPAM